MHMHGDACVLFQEPQVMIDKTVLTHHNAQHMLWEGARCNEHVGPLMSWGCWDRAVASGMARRMRQRAEAFNLVQEEALGHAAARLQ